MEWNFFRLYLKKNSLEIQYNIPLPLIVGNFQGITPCGPLSRLLTYKIKRIKIFPRTSWETFFFNFVFEEISTSTRYIYIFSFLMSTGFHFDRFFLTRKT